MPVKTAAIVGAGIAGLTAALALARKGIACDIFEQAETLSQAGAGLQVSPNAARVLNTLDILPELEAVWLEPKFIALVSGLTLSALARVPAGDFARNRWHAPYGVLHRATLQQALLASVASTPLCRLHLGARLDPSAGDRARIGTPDLIIGADGVWSKMRAAIPGSPSARFSGNIAWRFTIAEHQAPDFIDRGNVTAFLGPSTHLVCYPLKEASSLNLVAIASGMDLGESWQQSPDGHRSAMLLQQFSRWNPAISRLLAGDHADTMWPLYEARDGAWHNGRDTVLIGDAAHAMMPFAAQGAAMAIEDAFELAGLAARMDAPEALAAFDALRRPRIDKLRRRGDFNRFAYHARGPLRIARNLVLSLRPPQSLASGLDWIYGYQAED